MSTIKTNLHNRMHTRIFDRLCELSDTLMDRIGMSTLTQYDPLTIVEALLEKYEMAEMRLVEMEDEEFVEAVHRIIFSSESDESECNDIFRVFCPRCGREIPPDYTECTCDEDGYYYHF